MHMLLHRQVRDDDFLNDSHKVQKPYVADDFLHQGMLFEMQYKYNKNHSQDSPSDNSGTQL